MSVFPDWFIVCAGKCSSCASNISKSKGVDVQLQRLKEIIDTDVAAFNQMMSESGVPAIIPIATIPVKR